MHSLGYGRQERRNGMYELCKQLALWWYKNNKNLSMLEQ
jgi:hypothetical protein